MYIASFGYSGSIPLRNYYFIMSKCVPERTIVQDRTALSTSQTWTIRTQWLWISVGYWNSKKHLFIFKRSRRIWQIWQDLGAKVETGRNRRNWVSFHSCRVLMKVKAKKAVRIFFVMLNIEFLLREERIEGRILFLIFDFSKNLLTFKSYCTAKNAVINYSETCSCGYFFYFVVFYASN